LKDTWTALKRVKAAILGLLPENLGSSTPVDEIEAYSLRSVSPKKANTRRHASLAGSSR
jgi:hypothetical protein